MNNRVGLAISALPMSHDCLWRTGSWFDNTEVPLERHGVLRSHYRPLTGVIRGVKTKLLSQMYDND